MEQNSMVGSGIGEFDDQETRNVRYINTNRL